MYYSKYTPLFLLGATVWVNPPLVAADEQESGGNALDSSVNLSITQTSSAEAVVAEGMVSYILTVKNVGSNDAANVQVVSSLPTEAEYVGFNDESSNWICERDVPVENEVPIENKVTCTLSNVLGSTETASLIIINVETPTLGILTHSATVSSDAVDVDESDNSSSKDVVVFGYEVSPMTGVAPDIVQLKGFSGDEVLTFVWESEHECVVGNETELVFNSPGLSDLVLTVFDTVFDVEAAKNCDTGESKAIKRVGNIVIDLQANMPPAARLEIGSRYLLEPGSFMLDASQSSDSKKGQKGVITNYEFSSSVDGELSSDATHTHESSLGEGEHVITLVAQDDKNGTSMASVPVNVGDSTRPLAYFTIEANEGMTAPANIKLNAEGSQDYFGYDPSVVPTINSYRWTITGPNGNLNGLNKEFDIPTKSVSFNDSGNYRISLTVTDNDNQKSEAVQNIYLKSGVPTVSASVSPSKGQRPLIVALTPKFIDPDDFPYESCVWKIEGQEFNCLSKKSYVFEQSGDFSVNVTVVDHKGIERVSRSRTVRVTDPEAPVITSLEMTPTKGFAPLKVHVKGTASDPNGDDIVSFKWDDQFVSLYGPITDLNPFGEIGEYYVTLTVTDDTGLTDTSLPKTITVVKPPEMIASVTEGEPGLNVIFELNSYHPELTYQWSRSRDDSEPVNLEDVDDPRVVLMTFDDPGKHQVKLTVTDKNGTPKEVNQEITIKTPDECLAIITGIPSEIHVDDIPTLGLKADGSQSTCTNFEWFIDDATIPVCSDEFCDFTFDTFDNELGIHTVALTVSDDYTTHTTEPATSIHIWNIEAIIDPKSPLMTIYVGDIVTIDGRQSTGPIETRTWYIDTIEYKKCSSLDVCPFKFEETGLYNITLVVSGKGKTSAPASVTVDVIPPIKAIIEPLPLPPIWSDESLFVDGSKSEGPDDMTYQWFIDKATTPSCSDKTCNLPFEAAGEHEITLTVTGNSGKTNSTSVMVDVLQPPEAFIEAFIDGSKLPLPITIDVGEKVKIDGSQSTGRIDTYTWYLDNGTEPTKCSLDFCYFTFYEADNHEIRLEVSGAGRPSHTSVTVNVVEPPQEVKAVIALEKPTVFLDEEKTVKVKVDGSKSTGDTYTWFIEGVSQDCSLKICYFTFDKAGKYDIRLDVSGSTESHDTVQIEVKDDLEAIIDPVPESPVSVCDNGNNVKVKVDGSKSTGPIDTYTWYLGEEKYECSFDICYFTFYEAKDNYIRLKVSGKGQDDDESEPVSIKVEPCTLTAKITMPTSVEAGRQVTADGSQSTGPIKNYAWYVDNGLSCSSKNPVCNKLTFDKEGKSNVTLAVTGDGIADSTSVTVDVWKLKAVIDDVPSKIWLDETLKIDAKREDRIDTYTWFVDGFKKQEGPSSYFDFKVDQAGSYKITLEVLSGDVKSKPALVTVEVSELVADFEIPSKVWIGEPINVDGSASKDQIETYRWFIDGTEQSCASESEHECALNFEKAGTYNVMLKVKSGKEEAEKSVKVEVYDLLPVIEIPGSILLDDSTEHPKVIIEANPKVIVDGSLSQKSDLIQEYTWFLDNIRKNCGDTTLGTCPFAFDQAGIYYITLRIVDDQNGEAKTTTTVEVCSVEDVKLNASKTVVGVNHEVIVSVNAPQCFKKYLVKTYNWSVNGEPHDCSSDSCNLTFEEVGEYKVTLSVETDGEQPVIEPITIEVAKLFAVPHITSKNSGTKPLTVELDGSQSTGVSDDGYKWQAYVYDMSYGEPVYGKETSMTFDECGTYDISLTVTDEKDKSHTTYTSKVVEVAKLEDIPSQWVQVWDSEYDVCFHPLKKEYKPGDTLVLNLGVTDSPDCSSKSGFDLWVALAVPTGAFGTAPNFPYLYFSGAEGWIYEEDVLLPPKPPVRMPYNLLKYPFTADNLPPLESYVFYAAFVERESLETCSKNPLAGMKTSIKEGMD